MTDGGQDFNLGHVVGADGAKGDHGSTLWNTSTAPTYANSKYTFTKSNLSGKTGLTVAVNDIIFYSTYYYIVSAVNSTTVDCATRVSIKGSDASVTIVDNLTSDSSTSVLSAKQGKVLNTNKIETSAIATSFGSTTSDSKVPSEKLVKTELDKKIATSNTSGLVKNDGTIDTSSYITSSALSGYQTTSNLVTSFSSTTSDSKYPSEKLTKTELDKKIEKSNTVGLVKNDGSIDTNTYLTSAVLPTKTSDLTNDGADGTNVFVSDNDTRLSDARTPTSHTHGYIKNDGKIDNDGTISDSDENYLVVTNANKLIGIGKASAEYILDYGAGDYTHIGSSEADNQGEINYLIDIALGERISKSNTGGLVKNDGTIDTSTYLTSASLSNYIQKSQTSGLLKNDGSIDTSSYITSSALSGYQTTANLVTSFGSTTSDSKYPSEKLTKTELDKKITKSNSATGLLKDDGTVMTSGTGSTNWAVGNHTHSGYISTSSTAGLVKNDGSIMTSGTGSTNYAAGDHTHSGMLTSSDIYDGLDSTATNKALSAKQGKALNDLIGAAITYIVGSGS